MYIFILSHVRLSRSARAIRPPHHPLAFFSRSANFSGVMSHRSIFLGNDQQTSRDSKTPLAITARSKKSAKNHQQIIKKSAKNHYQSSMESMNGYKQTKKISQRVKMG